MAVSRRAPAVQPDPEQRRAIEHLYGPMLVVAGAGTGKTTVLIRRIARLVRTGKAKPAEILALTYTDNAAKEMAERADSELHADSAGALQVFTFHAYCHELLKRCGKEFGVLDDKQLWVYLRRNIRQLGLNHFVRAANVSKFLDDLLDFIRRCHDELVGPHQYRDYVSRLESGELPLPRVAKSKDAASISDEEALGRCREIASVFERVEQILQAKNLGTFGHMLVHAHRLLRDDPELLRQERARARYILVDEFQDANFAQIQILKLLAGEGDEPRNVFAVGDPDQGIYRFRGASSDAFELFQREFAESKLVVLGTNRRSTTPILKCAHVVIAKNPEFCLGGDGAQYRRVSLVSQRDENERDKAANRAPVAAVLVNSGFMEATDLVATLKELRARSRCAWKDFGVLYRIHIHRDEVAAELARNNIPFTIEGLDVMDTPEVRDLLACLGAAVSPASSAAVFRVAALRQFSVDAEELRAAMKSQPREMEAVLVTMLPKVKGGQKLLDTIEHARQAIAGKRAHAALLTLARVFSLPRNSALQALLEFATKWEQLPITETGEPGEFLDYLDYFREARGTIPLQARDEEDAVRLMSVHGAKGLEFEHVFVLRVASNSFPASYRESLIAFPSELRTSIPQHPQDDKTLYEQEERRLFYVAMTRARDTLHLYARFGKGKTEKIPAGYLRELLKDASLRPWLKQKTCREFQTEIFAEEAAAPGLSRLEEWISLPPGSDLSATLSASAIDRYKVCPLQFKLEREWRIPAEVSAAVQYGASVHRALLAYYDSVRWGRAMSEEAVLDYFRSDLAQEGIPDRYQHELYEEQGIAQLKAFLATAASSKPEVLHTEERFAVKIGGTNLVGRMDRIDRVADNSVVITDYKTGRPKSQEDADDSLQLSLYALAAREKWGYQVERLVFYNLEGNTAISTHRTSAQLDQVRLEVEDIVARIAAGDFKPTPGFQCSSCAYKMLCPRTEKRVPEVASALREYVDL